VFRTQHLTKTHGKVEVLNSYKSKARDVTWSPDSIKVAFNGTHGRYKTEIIVVDYNTKQTSIIDFSAINDRLKDKIAFENSAQLNSPGPSVYFDKWSKNSDKIIVNYNGRDINGEVKGKVIYGTGNNYAEVITINTNLEDFIQ